MEPKKVQNPVRAAVPKEVALWGVLPSAKPADRPGPADLFVLPGQNQRPPEGGLWESREGIQRAIGAEEDLLRRNQGDPLKLDRLNEADRLYGKAEALGEKIHRFDVLYACRDAQRKILRAAKRNDVAALKEAEKTVAALQKYAALEQVMFATMRRLAEKYPANSSLALRLDISDIGLANKEYLFPFFSAPKQKEPDPHYSERHMAPFEPTLEHMKGLGVIQVYGALKKSTNDEERRIAGVVDQAVKEFRENRWSYSFSWSDTAERIRIPPISTQQIEEYSRKLEGVYRSGFEMRYFLAKIEEHEAEAIQKNEGFKTRGELDESLKALGGFQQLTKVYRTDFENALSVLDEIGKEQNAGERIELSPKLLKVHQDFMVKRGQSYVRFLEAEEKRLVAEDAQERRVANYHRMDPDAKFMISRPQAHTHDREIRDIREKKADVLKDIAAVSALDVSRPENLETSFNALKVQCALFAKHEEAHVRGMLGKMLSQAKAIPSEKDSGKDPLGEIGKGLEAISPERMGALEDRIAVYRAMDGQIRGEVAIRLVDARIKQCEEFVGEGKAATRMSDALEVLTRPLIGESKRVATNSEVLLERYRGIRAKLLSADPDQKSQAMADFSRLEIANIRDWAQKSYESDALQNRFTIGLGIVIASAFVAGAAVALAAPFLEGVAGGALILHAINGSVFTVTHSVLDSAAKGKDIFHELFQWSTLGEGILNTAMFASLRPALKLYEAWFEKGLMAVAERRVGKELALQEVARMKSGMALQGAQSVGAFAAEAGVVEGYGFFVDVGRRVAKGDPNAVENALKRSFSTESMVSGPLLLLALKVGSHFSSPLMNPAMEGIWKFSLDKKIQWDLKPVREAADAYRGSIGELSAQGDMKQCAEMLNGYEDALLAEKLHLERVPEQARSERMREQLRENQALLDQMQVLKGFWNGFSKLGAHGVQETGSGLYSYRHGARDALVRDLKGMGPYVSVKVLGDTVVADFRVPGMEPHNKTFDPEALKQLPR